MPTETRTNYQDLRVWQEAMVLVPRIYDAVRRIPSEERFDLASQIRRAAISVPANIAEGQARQHLKEFLQCLFIARGSLAELETLLILAERLSYPRPEEVEGLKGDLSKVRMPLQGLINRLRQKN